MSKIEWFPAEETGANKFPTEFPKCLFCFFPIDLIMIILANVFSHRD